MKVLPVFIHCRLWFGTIIWILVKDRFQILDERLLKLKIPDFSSLTREARIKKADAFLNRLPQPIELKWRRPIPNVDAPLRNVQGDSATGARTLLSLAELFPDTLLGLRILADLLVSMRCEHLREIEPTFHPAMHLRKANQEQVHLFTVITNAAVTKSDHKKGQMSIKRNPILDFGSDKDSHIQDFSRIKVHVKRHYTAVAPVAYTDTIALVIAPESKQIKEAAPYLENAGVLFLNGKVPSDWAVDTISPSSVSSYDPSIAAQLEEHREQTAALLHTWWLGDSYPWAENIIKTARASFGKPDTRYISVTLDPKKLRDAIRYCVLSSFLDMLQEREILPVAELSAYRARVNDSFHPSEEDTNHSRNVESPETFLSIMRTIVSEQAEKIAGADNAFHKADKLIGAWRSIAGEDYLILPETVWSKAYGQAARKAKNVNTEFLKRENWERDLQKILSQAEVIKQASSGYRYRYDLYSTNNRDNTYVIAVPKRLLNDSPDVQSERQTASLPGKLVCPIPSPEFPENPNFLC